MTADTLTHLTDGQDVFIPYGLLGHYPAEDPRAHAKITKHHADVNLPNHPYSGHPMIAVADESDRMIFVAINRIAHSSRCRICAPVWKRYSVLAHEISAEEPGAMITAGMNVPLNDGQKAMLLVDAQDLPEDEEETS